MPVRVKFRVVALSALIGAIHLGALSAPPAQAADQLSPVALPIVLPSLAQPAPVQPPPAPSIAAQPAPTQPAAVQPAPAQPTSVVATAPPGQRSWMADKSDYFKPFDLAWNDGKWLVGGYVGVAARSNLSTLLLRGEARYTKEYVVLATLGREIGSLGNALRFEWETGLGVHFGSQTFVDAHLYFVARWIWFPWNRWLPTTIAIGSGPSFASAKPDLENEHGTAGYYKNGLMLELTVAPPDSPDWMLSARIHHRSSVFGLLHNGSPSDYVTIGIVHRF